MRMGCSCDAFDTNGAGVIGHKTVQYDLCGDAVNTAARMCAHSLPDHVHVSETTHALLCHRFASVCRGEREIKGKGHMTTYFLLNLPSGQHEIGLSYLGPRLLGYASPAPVPPTVAAGCSAESFDVACDVASSSTASMAQLQVVDVHAGS